MNELGIILALFVGGFAVILILGCFVIHSLFEDEFDA